MFQRTSQAHTQNHWSVQDHGEEREEELMAEFLNFFSNQSESLGQDSF
jgi:hypothetical protein